MWKIVVLTVFACSVVLRAEARKPFRKPSYIKPCSRSAPDFRQCCIKHGNEALPFLLQGDKNLKVPNMLPFRVARVDVDAGPNLKITLFDLAVYGLENVKLNDMSIDFDKKSVYFEFYCDWASLIGKYEVHGKILVLPVEGNGPANITIHENVFKYRFYYEVETREGIDYAIVQDKDHLEFSIGKAYIKFDNLFNGNKQMGDNVNNFLNENDQEVIKELGNAITVTVTRMARNVGGRILATVPTKELFLP